MTTDTPKPAAPASEREPNEAEKLRILLDVARAERDFWKDAEAAARRALPVAFGCPSYTVAAGVSWLADELRRTRRRLPDHEALRAAIQRMADWIGDHWNRKDWGVEGEKLDEAMARLHGIAELVGFDIRAGAFVKAAP